ncbi:MAG: YjjG family noncanonical pyrimidine nucleotidase [Bacteroidales bacterium]|nr:YjjG family noncanonical pyrimidine nucleotidase [Bacteroidales bacterium]
MAYKHLFFDLDRTLWDYDANAGKALSSVYNKFKLGRFFSSAGDFSDIYYHHNDLLWDQYRSGNVSKEELRTRRFALTLKEKGVNDPKLSEEIGREYMAITPAFNILAPNTTDVLEYLKTKGYDLYILTNGFLSTQVKKMTNSRINHFFDRIFSSEEINVNKPNKEIFHWAVSSLNARKQECLMVGDDIEVDIKGAMRYGLDAVWFNPYKANSDFSPTYTITDLNELKDIL